MRKFLISIGILLVIQCWSQTKNFNTEQEIWQKGDIQLRDGRKYNGEINYNFVVDQLKVKKPDGSVRNSSPVSVAYFIMDDGSKKRKFYSLENDFNFKGKRLNGKRTNAFFEEIYHNSKYIVLTKLLIETKNGSLGTVLNGLPGPSFNLAKEKVMEFVFIADKTGKITPILKRRKSTDRSLTGVGYTGISHSGLYENYSQTLEKSTTKIEIERYFLTKKGNIKKALANDYDRFHEISKEKGIDIKTLSGLVEAIRLSLD